MKANAGDKPQAKDAGPGRHGLQHEMLRKLMRLNACEWRLESGSLPGFAVGDIVSVDIADDTYTFSKPGAGQVARLPIASSQEETTGMSGWMEVRNHAEGVRFTLSPTAKLTGAWWVAGVNEGAGRGGSPKP